MNNFVNHELQTSCKLLTSASKRLNHLVNNNSSLEKKITFLIGYYMIEYTKTMNFVRIFFLV